MASQTALVAVVAFATTAALLMCLFLLCYIMKSFFIMLKPCFYSPERITTTDWSYQPMVGRQETRIVFPEPSAPIFEDEENIYTELTV